MMLRSSIKDPGVKTYIDGTFGGIEKLTMDILVDFFKGGTIFSRFFAR